MAEKDIVEKMLMSYAGEQKILHLEALGDMMEALTGDTRFTELAGNLMKKEQYGEAIMMCEYINVLEARGEAKGEKKGEAKLTSLLETLYDLGRDEEAKQAVRDMSTRAKLYEEFRISNDFREEE